MDAIYSYTDYRSYLGDYYAEQKATQSGFSYQKFSERAGLKSANYLKLIIEGKRNLTIANIHRFSRAIGHTQDELRCFETLVLWNQAESGDEKRYYEKRLEELTDFKPKRMKRLNMDDLISQWYYPGVWVSMDGLEESESDLAAKKVGITLAKFKEAAKLLVESGIISFHDGTYKARNDMLLYHDKKMWNRSQKKYLEEQLERSKLALERQYDKNGKFYAHTFTIAEGQLPAYNQKVIGFLEDLSDLANAEPPETLVQMNIQLFPMAIT